MLNFLQHGGVCKNKLLLLAKNHHPCLGIGRKPLEICDEADEAPVKLTALAAKNGKSGWCAILNSANSFWGTRECVGLSPIVQRADWCVVDVSHSMFLWDHRKTLELGNRNVLFLGSLGKAAAFPAGFAAGNKDFIDMIRCRPEYTAASPPARSIAYAFNRSEALREQKRQNLAFLVNEFEEQAGLEKREVMFPVYHLGANCENEYHKALEAGIKLSYLPYPLPKSECHLRMVITATHTPEDIVAVTTFLKRWEPASTTLCGAGDGWLVIDPRS